MKRADRWGARPVILMVAGGLLLILLLDRYLASGSAFGGPKPPTDVIFTAAGNAPELSMTSVSASADRRRQSEATPETISITLRNLAGGGPVGGVPLRGIQQQPEMAWDQLLTTNSIGMITVDRDAVGSVQSDDELWVIPPQSREKIIDSGELWCYGWVTIRGRVESLARAGEGGVRADLKVLARPRMDLRTGPSRHSTRLAKLGIRRSLGRCKTDSDGTFEIRVPRVDGILLCARSRGGEKGTVRVEVAPSETEVFVRVVMDQAAVVSGLLLGSDGEPIRNQPVRVYSSWNTQLSEVDLEAISSKGNGVTVSGHSASGDVRVCVKATGVTDDEGRFKMKLYSEGSGLLVAYVPGHRPIRVSLGAVRFSSRDIGAVYGESAELAERVRFTRGAQGLAGCPVNIVDVTSKAGQYVVLNDHLDAQSSISGEWLEVGREYFVQIAGQGPDSRVSQGCFVWDGSSHIDVLTALGKMTPKGIGR